MNMALKFLLLFFIPISASASWDLSFEQLVRTFPTGLYLKSTAGFTQKFWQGDKPFLYGYIRPAIALQTSAVVNAAKAHIDFNPISFINFSVGKSFTNRNISEISSFNCTEVICRAKLNRTFYGARTALSFKGISLLAGVKWSRVHLKEASLLSFADELSSTIAAAGNDLLIQKTLLLGFQLNSKLFLAYLGQYNRMRNTDSKTKMHAALSQLKLGPRLKISFGPAIFETRSESRNLSVLSILQWNFKEGPILAN